MRTDATAGGEPTALAWNERLALIVLCVVAGGTGLAFDAGAFDAFDAPKRLIACVGAALCAALVLCAPPRARPQPILVARAIRALLLLGAAAMVLAASLASRSAASWDALRTVALFAALLPLGASALLQRPQARWVVLAFALAIGANAAVSLLQIAGVDPIPLAIVRLGGRLPSGALLGNEGYVALACALALPASLVVARSPAPARLRLAALGLGVLCVAAIGGNRQMTAALAALVGLATVGLLRLRALRAFQVAVAAALLLLATLAVPPLRAATWAHVDPGIDTLEIRTTYRISAWLAAERMARTRPWTGYGPGAYAAQSQAQRLAVEREQGVRLHLPPNATHHARAHDDYRQLAAEAGWPALIALLAAFVALLLALARRAIDDREARALAGTLASGAVAALAWFPLQVPLLAALLLLVAGRAWRRISEPPC